jgi:hypothetical protein
MLRQRLAKASPADAMTELLRTMKQAKTKDELVKRILEGG